MSGWHLDRDVGEWTQMGCLQSGRVAGGNLTDRREAGVAEHPDRQVELGGEENEWAGLEKKKVSLDGEQGREE